MNLLATVGAFAIAASVLLFIVNVARSWRHGAVAGADPWHAGTLEWTMDSPPPPHNFDAVPVVEGREPAWDRRPRRAVSGLAADAREVLTTSVRDAEPLTRPLFPSPSLWPFISAVATTALFVTSVFTPWAVVWGAVPVTLAVIAWFWPGRAETRQALALETKP
jgi:hypothetical protein